MTRKLRKAGAATTLDDVAALAGVSRITASRVVNGGQHVSKTKRDLVMKAVAELNYLPNLAARSLVGAQESRIALVYANPSSTYLGELVMGALSGASKLGTQIMLKPWRSTSAAEERDAAARLAKNVEGVVLPSPLCDSEVIVTELVNAGIAIVAVGPGRIPEPLSCVRIDDFRASFEVTSYLIKLGHTRIGFITGNPAQSVSGRRLEGYKAAISGSGMEIDTTLIKQGYFTYQSGLEATESLLSNDNPPTAIFASNDDMATAVVNVAHRRGLDIPKDLSVFGFDDLSMAVTVWPTLSTVHQPVADMAEKAIELLMHNIRRKDDDLKSVDHVVSHRLVLRDSTAEAPARKYSVTSRYGT
ncbi:MAG TPA: LacI family DNA-binding transcriptional regulator [Steroidobacteraceae bacterium]|nr:LacI family DNA-binding transcriptional regulator [Steroidobacteraceae bacterium]